MDLTLYAGADGMSPWSFHVMVALEEKRLPYKLELVPMPIPAATKAVLRDKAITGKIPVLVHGDRWIIESLAISEYLAEQFPAPDHPRLFPADLGERARARAILSMMRTTMHGLRDDRPTSSIFGKPVRDKPLSVKGKADADDLVRVASAFLAGKPTICPDWCIADADLAHMLMRLVANDDPVPPEIAAYVRAQWQRPSIQTFVSRVPS